jgi:radical SAM protein with 4Fe4S-binding SPASM domain
MKAEVAIRKNPQRTDLSAVAPLATPFVLFVDPSSSCNFKCTFCPTGDLPLIKSIGRFQGTLPESDFEKILRDVAEFPDRVKVLRLYKDGEPLVNKRLPSMIRSAKDSGLFGSIDTTTNAGLLTHDRSQALIEAGLDLINISIDGLDAEQFQHFAKAKVDFGKFVDEIAYLHEISGDCLIVVKTTREIIGTDREQEFLDIFGDISDRIYVENTSPCWPDFDVEERMGIEINTGLYGNEIVDQTACPYLFYSISVNSDMKVSACFVDWSRQLIVGDLREQSLMEVWNSPEMNAHRRAHLDGQRKSHPVCGGCGQISHCGPDSIEETRSVIMEKYISTGEFDNLDTYVTDAGYSLGSAGGS